MAIETRTIYCMICEATQIGLIKKDDSTSVAGWTQATKCYVCETCLPQYLASLPPEGQ